MKKLLLLTSIFLGVFSANCQVVTLIDSYTGENVNFEKINTLPVGAKVDNIIYAKKGNSYYKRKFSGSVNMEILGLDKTGHIDASIKIQTLLNNVDEGSVVHFPAGKFLINTKININKRVILQGSGISDTYFITNGNDGIQINVSGVKMLDFSVNNASRFTQVANNLTGINVNGAVNNYLSKILLQNVNVDGYKIAFKLRYMWDSSFQGVKTYAVNKGVEISGLSVNNEITNNSSFLVGGSNSYGIHFVGDVVNEGWTISNSLIFGAYYGIWSESTSHVRIVNSMIDFCEFIGLYIGSNSVGSSLNWNISGNYIAMSGTANLAIFLNNSFYNIQNRGTKIINNDILVYGNSTASRGVYVAGSENKYDNISNNSFDGFSQYSIEANSALSTIVIGNSTTNNLSTAYYINSPTLSSNNLGNTTYK